MDNPKSILDKRFAYTDSANTDIRKRFDRIRREQRKAKAEQRNVYEIKKQKGRNNGE